MAMPTAMAMPAAMPMTSTGLPWLDQPVMLHSSRADTCKLTVEQCAFRSQYWLYWYQSDHVYALPVVYFLCAIVALFAIVNVFSKRTPRLLSDNAWWRRVVAVFRYLSYRCYKVRRMRSSSPTLGIMILGFVGTAFLLGLTFGEMPYYWPNTTTLTFGSSPPIATRTGLMALALLPFVLVLAAKANLVTVLTSISHEKLMVFHRWISWAMMLLALIHTFPFIIYHVWKGDMVMQWNTSVTYWTGTVAILAQAWLSAMSIGPIRNRYYEFFKSSHYIATVVFLIFFFIHCDFRLSTWDYFIASAVAYGSCLLYSQLRTYFKYDFHDATLFLLPSGTIQVVVPVEFSWTPGQHVFVRFITLGLHALTAHPFTICSLPFPYKGQHSELIFFIQPSKGGITARLAKLARQSSTSSMSVLLDGPYGGVDTKPFVRFDKLLIIAGGSGTGFTLPLIEDILQRQQGSGNASKEKKTDSPRLELQVVLTTRSEETREWFHKALNELLASCPSSLASLNVQVCIHVTRCVIGCECHCAKSGDSVESSAGLKLETNLDSDAASSHVSIVTTSTSRPKLPAIVKDATSTPNTSVAIIVCGPSTMLHDVRNGAADAQVQILRGEGAKEVYLHTEHFSW